MGRHNRPRGWNGRANSGRVVGRQSACRKRAFQTRDAAQEAMRTFRSSNPVAGVENIPTRVQECDQCGLYHLTTATGKPAPAGRMRRRRKGGGGWT